MPESRPPMKVVLIVVGGSAAISLFAGVMAGVHQDWMRMSLFLFGGVLAVFFATLRCLITGLEDRLGCLEARFQVDQSPVLSIRRRRIQAAVGAFMVLSVAAHMSFSALAGFRGEWLRMALHLSACSITAIVCTSIVAMLSLGPRLSHLEQRAADTIVDVPQS